LAKIALTGLSLARNHTDAGNVRFGGNIHKEKSVLKIKIINRLICRVLMLFVGKDLARVMNAIDAGSKAWRL
jgi:hypothetical protein